MNPCENFYTYTCESQFKKPDGSISGFRSLVAEAQDNVIAKLKGKSPLYISLSLSFILFFDFVIKIVKRVYINQLTIQIQRIYHYSYLRR